MKICFTLDDVIRAKTSQIGKIYKKYKDSSIDLEKLDLSSGNMKEIFGFKTVKEYQDFLYTDYCYEIFAEATTTEKMVDKKLNLWQLSLNNNDTLKESVELMIGNTKEFNTSIGYTHFFLSKIATRIRETYFPADSIQLWNKADVIVTTDKTVLENKPKGKVSIKIEMPYNKNVESDYTYKTLSSLLDDTELIEKIGEKLHG